MSDSQELKRLVGQLQQGVVSRRDFVVRALALGLSVSSVGALLSACQGKEKPGGTPGDTTKPAAEAADLGPIEKELHIYNWSDYIAEDTVPNFEKEFG